ncbi:MAG TPA: FAD-binding oxidoreductase [Steroidobacteraceae bacterium]|nr:FAD-binding oxidoreductase [Steroidobacteraceae bacterium]
MRRRTFCAAGFAALAATSLPHRRVLGAVQGDLPAVGLEGQSLMLKAGDIEELRSGLRGELLSPGDAGYDDARRLWNAAFNRKPALIARCAGAADVIHAVGFAAAHGVLTAVRGGAHSLSGQSVCDGGFVIDLSAMRSVHIDPAAKLARAEPGVLLGQFDREAQAFGLATTAGTASDTGLAGLTLGGGLGRIGQKFGLTIDNLTGADVVTADGRLLRADAHENPDLYWALRGGGGNFGVVTSFEYRLHPVGPMLFGGEISYPFTDARRLLRSFADYIASAPDELSVMADVNLDAKEPPTVSLDVCYCGPPADGERVVAPLRRFGKPLADKLGPATYVKLQGAANPVKPFPYGGYFKGGLVRAITPSLIDAVVDYIEAAPLPTGFGEIGFQPCGGAAGRVAPEATAFWNRHASYDMGMFALWPVPGDGAERNTAWTRAAWEKLGQFAEGYYVNLGESLQEAHTHRIRAAYGGNYPRLVALKKRYDPGNLFRLNANIKPA